MEPIQRLLFLSFFALASVTFGLSYNTDRPSVNQITGRFPASDLDTPIVVPVKNDRRDFLKSIGLGDGSINEIRRAEVELFTAISKSAMNRSDEQMIETDPDYLVKAESKYRQVIGSKMDANQLSKYKDYLSSNKAVIRHSGATFSYTLLAKWVQ